MPLDARRNPEERPLAELAAAVPVARALAELRERQADIARRLEETRAAELAAIAGSARGEGNRDIVPSLTAQVARLKDERRRIKPMMEPLQIDEGVAVARALKSRAGAAAARAEFAFAEWEAAVADLNEVSRLIGVRSDEKFWLPWLNVMPDAKAAFEGFLRALRGRGAA